MGPSGSSAPKMAAGAVRGILQLFKLLLLEICVSVCLQTVCSNVPPLYIAHAFAAQLLA